MSEIIAYKDQNNEYFDSEVENSKPIKANSEDANELGAPSAPLAALFLILIVDAISKSYPPLRF